MATKIIYLFLFKHLCQLVKGVRLTEKNAINLDSNRLKTVYNEPFLEQKLQVIYRFLHQGDYNKYETIYDQVDLKLA
jgi:hypothetical protein